MQMHEEEEERRLLQRDYTNVLAHEFKTTTIERFCEEVSILIINVNELKSESVIFNQSANEVVSDVNMFSLGVLDGIFGDFNGIDIVTVYGEMFLTNTIIKEFLHPKELSATTTYSNVFYLGGGEIYRILLLTHPRDKIIS